MEAKHYVKATELNNSMKNCNYLHETKKHAVRVISVIAKENQDILPDGIPMVLYMVKFIDINTDEINELSIEEFNNHFLHS